MEEPGAKWRSYQESLRRETRDRRAKRAERARPETARLEAARPERARRAKKAGAGKTRPADFLRYAGREAAKQARRVRSAVRGMSFDVAGAKERASGWLSRQKEIRSPAVIVLAAIACLCVIGLVVAGIIALPRRGEKIPKLPREGWSRVNVRQILGDTPIDTWNGPEKIKKGGHAYVVTPAFSPELQAHMRDAINPQHARWIGFAAMDPFSGRILAATGFGREDVLGEEHPVFTHLYPAASIFKIVTATAAVDLVHLNADTPIGYGGGKYTLYKNQIRPDQTLQANQVLLKEAFGGSINPAFGLIGAYMVGPEKLLGMACSFGFGRKLDIEIETAQPLCPFPEAGDDFGVAQIASGFNRTTLITPVNGAAFVSAIVNDGVYLEPSIVLGVTDEEGRLVYESIKKEVGSVCSPPAALEIRKMMEETITGGTARRLFSGYAKDPVLGQLELGGKTGSINDGVVPNVRYDWFVGYARERGGSHALAVASVVAHEKFIGERAAHYAKEAFRFYFADLEKKAADIR